MIMKKIVPIPPRATSALRREFRAIAKVVGISTFGEAERARVSASLERSWIEFVSNHHIEVKTPHAMTVQNRYVIAMMFAKYCLENFLPDDLAYHIDAHSIADVLPTTIRLVEKHNELVMRNDKRVEGQDIISEKELMLLKVAAMFHDVGFMFLYRRNEPVGAFIAELILTKLGFREKNSALVKGMILATTVPQSPKNLLSQLLCDADVANLGRPDFWYKNGLCYAEQKKHGITYSPDAWVGGAEGFLNGAILNTKKSDEGGEFHTAAAMALFKGARVRNLRMVAELKAIPLDAIKIEEEFMASAKKRLTVLAKYGIWLLSELGICLFDNHPCFNDRTKAVIQEQMTRTMVHIGKPPECVTHLGPEIFQKNVQMGISVPLEIYFTQMTSGYLR